VTFDGYGNDAFVGPERTTGTFNVQQQATDRHSFEAHVTRRGGVTTEIDYVGSVTGGYTGPTTWNGSGSITRNGDFFDGGTVEAETVDQLRDNAICNGEGISGRTTMTSAEHVVVIEYDGATACDDRDAARWSRDGEDRGTIDGITCSAGGAGGYGALVVVVALLTRRGARRRSRRGFARRRRRRSTSSTPRSACRPCRATS
jgi:hypothetical protein